MWFPRSLPSHAAYGASILTEGYNKLVVGLTVSVQKPENGLAACCVFPSRGKAENTVWPDDASSRRDIQHETSPSIISSQKEDPHPSGAD